MIVVNIQNLETKMTESTKAEIQQATESIIVARITLMMKHPFLGNLVSRLLLKPTDEISTAATDGRSILYNPKFVNKLKKKEVEFLCGHECYHVLLEHAGVDCRMNGRDQKIFNFAADFCVNLMLVEQGVGELITTVPVLYDKKYSNWSTEQIYDDLMQKSDDEKAAMSGKVLDEHLKDTDESGPDGTQMTSEERQALKDDIREAMISAAQSCDPSSIPAGLKRLIGEFTEPKIDWRELIQQQIESQVKFDFTYSKPSRRSGGMDVILPSTKKEPAIECTIAIDTSGSITNKMVQEFLSEVNGIMGMYASFKVAVCCWDTSLYNYQEFDENTSEDLLSYEIKGGGGTDISCVFNYFEENEIEPKQLIVFTDMELYGGWGDENLCDTIWLAKDSNKVAPYGTTIKFS